MVDTPFSANSRLFGDNNKDKTPVGHHLLSACFFLDSAWTTTASSGAPAKSPTSASTEPGKQMGKFTESSGVKFLW